MNAKSIQIAISIVAVVVAILHLVFPNLAIDAITLTLVVLAVVPWLAPLFKSLELPGGWKLEFQELLAAKERADKAGLLSPAVDASAVQKYSFQLVADEDPNLALAGLRIELERRLVQIAESHKIPSQRRSVGQLLRILSEHELLTQEERSILSDILSLLNGAVHGASVDSRAADWAMKTGPRLLSSLDERISKRP